jgi:hypothetical protein
MKKFDDLSPQEKAARLAEEERLALADAIRQSGGDTSVRPDNSRGRVRTSENGGDRG